MKSTQPSLVLIGLHDFLIFSNRTAHAWSVEAGNICSVSVFFVRVGSQISPRRAKKYSNIPSSGRTRSVKWPTPGTTKTINRCINLRFCIDHRIAMAKKWRVKESEWILAGRMTMTFLDLLTLFYLSQWLSEDGTLYHAKTTFPKQLGHKCIVIYDQQQHHIHRLIVHITDYTEHWILFIWSRY